MLGLLLMVALPGAAQPIRVTYNGRPLATTAPPIEQSGRVLVAMRDIFEALDAAVEWTAATRTVRARHGQTQIVLTIGSSTAYVGGRAVPLAVPAQIRGGHTYVPLRFVAEASGAQVQWLAATRSVAIVSASGGSTKPPSSIHAPLAPPVVTSPRANDRVGPAVDVVGRTTPGSAIRIVTYVHRRSNGELIAQVPGIVHDVGANGEFSHRIALPSNKDRSPQELYYDIHCWTLQGGDQSKPTIVRVYRK
jgi:hypothetical protein